jgi:carboxyl-terminal processing protease
MVRTAKPLVFVLWLLVAFWAGILVSQVSGLAYIGGGRLPGGVAASLGEAQELIGQVYYDPSRAHAEELRDGALSGYIQALKDPFSYFIPSAAARSMAETFQGQFGGIGISVEPVGNIYRIFSVLPGTPAEKAGLQPGDTIVAVNDKDISELGVYEIVESIRGPEDSEVALTVWREGFNEPRKFKITRVTIEVPSVSRVKRISRDTGFFRIEMFNEKTPQQVEKALMELRGSGPLRWVVVDLRFNGGGLLESGIRTADIFLKEGVIVSVRGRQLDEVTRARPGGEGEDLRLAILVNEFTASASEIFAAALRENGRAFVTGKKTFGKASVQVVVPLASGGAVALVTAHYFTPTGKNISDQGIEPDIPLPDRADEVASLRNLWSAREQANAKATEIQQELAEALDAYWLERVLAEVGDAERRGLLQK